MKKLVMALVGLSLAGCGAKDANGDGIADGIRDPDSVTLVAPSTPLGSVSGTVLNSRHQPIEGATVTLNIQAAPAQDEEPVAGPVTATTDANGFFVAGKLPGGAQVQVVITKAGFSTARQQVTIPTSAGNFPINNGNAAVGPIALFELNETVKVQVLTHSGRPASGAKAYLEAFPAFLLLPSSNQGGSADYGAKRDTIVVEGTADATGTFTFTGIPNRTEYERIGESYFITVQAHDENGDGVADSAGTVEQITASSLTLDPSMRTVILNDARSTSGFQLLASNAAGLANNPAGINTIENFVTLNEPISLVFNHPIQGASAVARILNETLLNEIPVTTSVSASGNTLNITPGVPLVNGAKYQAKFRVRSLSTGEEISRQGYFFAGDRRVPLPLAVVSMKIASDGGVLTNLESGETVRVQFNQPIRQFGTAPRTVQAFFNAQVNGTGTIGDGTGERGFDAGFPLQRVEHNNQPLQIFGGLSSDNSSTWDFQYFGVDLSVGQEAFLEFNGTRSTVSGYETMWGVPVESTLNGQIAQP